MNKFYQLSQKDNVADLYVYGDVTSCPLFDSDVDSYSLTNELNALEGVDKINVFINSYGGEVAEGLAIYNALKRHTAKVKTICDGFACSIASVIFMAGDERVMNGSSLLMIHNPWTYTAGNADELRKEADDLEKIAEASYSAYLEHINISRDELKDLLDAETWLTPSEALEMGFATTIKSDIKSDKQSQSARKAVFEMMTKHRVKDMCASVEETEPQAPETPVEETETPVEETETPVETVTETEQEKPSEVIGQPTIMEMMGLFFNAKN